jgi:hypothetical protein
MTTPSHKRGENIFTPSYSEARMGGITMSKRLLVNVMMSTLSVGRAFAADVFSGTWKMNLEQSQFSPGPILKPTGPNFIKIEATGSGLMFTSDGIDNKGRKTHGHYVVYFDGSDSVYEQMVDGKPDPDSAPSTVSLKQIDNHTLELTFKVDGRAVLIATLTVSSDGKKGTAISMGINADGTTSTSRVVYEKPNSRR